MGTDDSFCLVGIPCLKLDDQLPVIAIIRLIMCFDESIYRMEDIEVYGSMVLFDQCTDTGNLDKRVVEVQIFPPVFGHKGRRFVQLVSKAQQCRFVRLDRLTTVKTGCLAFQSLSNYQLTTDIFRRDRAYLGTFARDAFQKAFRL